MMLKRGSSRTTTDDCVAESTHVASGARVMGVTVLGATGSVGRRVTRRLAARGVPVTVIGRDRTRLAALPASEARVADLAAPAQIAAALVGAERIAVCVHARFAPAILAKLPATVRQIVLLGSTRLYTRFPDRKAEQVREGAAAFEASGMPGAMLHPTMIYGGETENNVRRLAACIRKIGVVPLPRGGRALIQPIHADDVAKAVVAALDGRFDRPRQVVLAGPAAMPYANFVRAIAAVIGRQVTIVSMSGPVLAAAVPFTHLIPGFPAITFGEIRRLGEDKAFDIGEMRALFGFDPMPLETGLTRTLAVAG